MLLKVQDLFICSIDFGLRALSGGGTHVLQPTLKSPLAVHGVMKCLNDGATMDCVVGTVAAVPVPKGYGIYLSIYLLGFPNSCFWLSGFSVKK